MKGNGSKPKKRTGTAPGKVVKSLSRSSMAKKLPGGGYQGKAPVKYKPKKVKPKTNYKSTGSKKGRPVKRKRKY
jgi:hypothetical protein